MKYRKKPVVIEAVRYTGTEESMVETWHFVKEREFIWTWMEI